MGLGGSLSDSLEGEGGVLIAPDLFSSGRCLKGMISLDIQHSNITL